MKPEPAQESPPTTSEPEQTTQANRVNGTLRAVLRQARRLIVLVVGSTVLLLGIVMLVTPGPAFVVIPIGLAILSLEFAWARRLLCRVREGVQTGMDWRNWDEWRWMVGLRRHRPDGSPSRCE
jgi:uncharacterized protein (TIGR02611 family)